ncbi:bifunctional 4-hydroxy-2-oxoglutarate aldolase/2-dehydro-3-deoxy-phosphogluconate aldolase [Picosynechococcus sp. PCC 11901]|uniref:bifunctional 4-hydroxy-2-oxoglutarate aldolase/2-dehydro-3-deoxy-phosphogluconate aldolase n=1 Tax=Picosynechococcus sp. PCC 11901 TaxID=2579791 RepID=UPI0010FBE7A5|nr:bifunctional 4-hydroxy-2-oxoglutarate aldolase/2-dehydro-3-deoxy-phosphogluconate aldolase [Picosynechococcus sp. PCC 11901]QCS48791.1 bifunctional 4-hydroxy-2-oxoglutarate aldolase/2-dehydro-3-deoxy-phosphogluconate aldolase [Picosynechococcus sp. PCC 11901]
MTPLQQRWFAQLQEHRAIAVIRASDWQLGIRMATTAIAGGLQLIEITWNSDQAGRIIATLREQFPQAIIGTGTILTPTDLKEAIACGATFAFSPHSDQELVDIAHHQDIPMVLGALTPSEIYQAWRWGSDGVKVFPIKAVGGASFIRCLQAPLPHIPLIPTGGVSLTNGPDLIQAGAIAVGLSSDLFPPAMLRQQEWQHLSQRLQQHHPSQW